VVDIPVSIPVVTPALQEVTRVPILANTQVAITVSIAAVEVVFTITAIIVLQGTGVTEAPIQVVGNLMRC